MSTVKAVTQLPPDELTAFRGWFAEFDATLRDRQLEADVKGGRLDQFAEEATMTTLEPRLAGHTNSKWKKYSVPAD